ncbi:MAG: VOC family protein [Gemmatimonadota bacterium]|nr:VOC family protein [Gemmatimonadota bacterium]
MPTIQRIAPCLWFDDQAEQAATFYTGIFPNSEIGSIARYGEVGFEFHGGPVFTFNEAISLQVFCETQEEVDHYWEKLSEGGDEGAQQCGWLKDKFGVSWQVVPTIVPEMVKDPESEKSQRAMAAIFQMKKLDIAEIERAYHG